MRNSRLKWLLLLLPALLAWRAVHDYHVSIVEIHHNTEENKLTISHQLFIDDLERGLSKLSSTPLQIGTAKEDPKTDEYIETYLNNRFSIYLNGKKAAISLVGKELEDHHNLWCYAQIKNVHHIDSLMLYNTVFTELFDDQQNLHHLYINGHKKSIAMNKGFFQTTLYF
jgi:hypothetical protein